jgi:2',3'-cyclic-nucleotide 2'-phosphodiesterase (5'-nucleotidase family)
VRQRRRMIWIALLAGALTGALMSAPAGAGSPKSEPVDIQILTFSDWHGQLDPLSGRGGAAVLSAYFDQERGANPNTLVFTAGDAVGASPPLASFFNEEPAVRAMRMMGVDADTLGNHNFDKGIAFLQNLIDIAGDTSGAEPGDPIAYVSANLENRDDNLSGVDDFVILEVGGVKVGVVGITNPEAPTLVFPGSFGTIEVTDPVSAANKAKAAAKRAGAKVLVVLTHMGVTGFDSDGNAFGPLIDFANNVGGFDLIVGDHTNVEFSGVINNALVVENLSKGVEYARVTMKVDPHNGRIIDRGVEFVSAVAADVTPDPEIEAFLAPLRAELSVLLGEIVGQSTVFIPRADSCGRSDGRLCESLVGNAVTDAMRSTYGTDFAITNAGGLRADLTCPTVDDPTDFCPAPDGGPHEITKGQVLTVLPFGNQVVTLQVTGTQLKAHLENGVSAMPGANGRFAQVSGLCFTYDVSAPAGSRVTSMVFQNPDGTCSATAIDMAATYTLAENDFMASGGDGYPNLIGTAVTRDLMDQVVRDHIAATTPISPAVQGRINCTTTGVTACPVTLP